MHQEIMNELEEKTIQIDDLSELIKNYKKGE